MIRLPHRTSRTLIVLLIVLVVPGALSIGYKLRQSAAAKAAQRPPSVSIAPAPDDADAELPTTRPEEMDDLAPAADSPTTKPSASNDLADSAQVASASVSAVLSDAQTQVTGGNLLEARKMLNDALMNGRLDTSEAQSAKTMIAQINQTVVFGSQRFADDLYGGTYVVQHGDSLAKIANVHDTTWEFLSRINGIDPRHLRAGATIKVVQGPFFAVVDKRAFTMDIYLGGLPGERSSLYVTSFEVGLGQDDSTPTGMWMIEPHHKLKHPTYYSPRGEGVIAADDPKNPLGGFWIGLSGTEGQAVGKMSYGIHGTIDPSSIGKQSSMGCIRMRAADIALVFDLMVEGKSMVLVK